MILDTIFLNNIYSVVLNKYKVQADLSDVLNAKVIT